MCHREDRGEARQWQALKNYKRITWAHKGLHTPSKAHNEINNHAQMLNLESQAKLTCTVLVCVEKPRSPESCCYAQRDMQKKRTISLWGDFTKHHITIKPSYKYFMSFYSPNDKTETQQRPNVHCEWWVFLKNNRFCRIHFCIWVICFSNKFLTKKLQTWAWANRRQWNKKCHVFLKWKNLVTLIQWNVLFKGIS